MNIRKNKPPRFAEWILEKIVNRYVTYAAMGDYEEEFNEVLQDSGKFKARLKYWIYAISLMPEYLLFVSIWRYNMLKSYLKTAFRNILKYKGYSLINISGLATGIACSILISLFVMDELSYDQFHEKSDRIYRIGARGVIGSTMINQAYTSGPVPAALHEDFPQIEDVVRIYTFSLTGISYNDRTFLESGVAAVDSTFFNIFTHKFVSGNPEDALMKPGTMVITESIAAKYFRDEDPIGKTIIMQNSGTNDMVVTGVIEDFPENSHFHFDVVVPHSTFTFDGDRNWMSNNYRTYLLLNEGADYKELEAQFPDFILNHIGRGRANWLGEGNSWEYFLQPLSDIHLNSDLNGEFEGNGNADYVNIFSLIAVFILLIACINYMNLSTARSASRAKEVGIRKVVGSFKSMIIKQFLSESVLISFISIGFGLIIITLILPYYNELTGKSLEINYIDNIYVIPGLVILGLIIGIISGTYPAFFLSSFKPVAVMHSGVSTGNKKSILRNMLVVFQFAVTIFLFIGTFIIRDQIGFIKNKKLGFDKEKIVVVENMQVLGTQVPVFKEALMQNSNIYNVSSSHTLPGRSFNNIYFAPVGQEAITLNLVTCDEDFLETYRMEMATGRFFSTKHSTDSTAIILNENAVKLLGWEADAIGKEFRREESNFHVIGVVKDFHYESIHQTIRPMAMFYNQGAFSWSSRYVSIKISAENIESTLNSIKEQWNELAPGLEFSYFFFNEDYNRLYDNEIQTGNIFTIFSILAIFIASLGLLGLASFVAEQSTKEIGIRKTLGASITNVVRQLSGGFLILVLIANIFAWPAAYYIMDTWLQSFAYSTSINLITFILASIFALILAMLTVSYQALKAANANPVESLRYE